MYNQMRTKSKSPVTKAKKSAPSHTQMDRFSSILVKAITSNFEQAETPVSHLLPLIRKSDWRGVYAWAATVLADKELTAVCSTPEKYFRFTQLAVLITKYPYPDGIDVLGDNKTPRERAIATFLDSEDRCRRSNRRLRASFYGNNVYSGRFRPLVEYMKGWIYHALGGEFSSSLGECGFGSGSSVGVHGKRTHLAAKLDKGEWTVTPAAVELAIETLWQDQQLRHHILAKGDASKIVCLDRQTFEGEVRSKIKLVDHNLISFVPKNAKTDRSIAIEPLLNGYLQKGIDNILRKRLLRMGYDLSDQTRNQRLARIGSIGGMLSTRDLSSASDSISLALCKVLLPSSWFRQLSLTRSTHYDLMGRKVPYEKVTSMGNGFCFPLQTLIFAAAARAALWATGAEDKRHAVYGDDIIVSKDAVSVLDTLLVFLGFKVNIEKSFTDGPFRESCGADWYDGQDVRPVYLDFHLLQTQHMMVFHNATLRNARTTSFFTEVRALLRDFVSPGERLLRPFTGYSPLTHDKTIHPTALFNINGAFDVPLDEFMCTRAAHWNRLEQRWSWTEFRFMAVEDERRYTSNAEYLLFLQGQREGKGAVRFAATRRRVKL